MGGLENPILYIEEFGPAPNLAHRHRVPGAAMVYRLPDGRLWCPAGGMTAGELLWRRPREVYLVTTLPHVADVACQLAYGSDGQVAELRFSAVWQVHDPVAAVAHRLTQPIALGHMGAAAWLNQSVADLATATLPGLFGTVTRLLPQRLELPGGLRVDLARLRWILPAGSDGSSHGSVLEAVLGTDPLREWKSHYDLAQRALVGLPDADPGGHAAGDDGGLLHDALQQYAALLDRLEDLLPDEGRAGLA